MNPVEIDLILNNSLTPEMVNVINSLNTAETDSVMLQHVVDALRTKLAELRDVKGPNLDQTSNIAMIEALENKLDEYERHLESIKNNGGSLPVPGVPEDMDKAVRRVNGLNVSIQQIAREMPALAMGPQMFFLAISNNLPIFTDELKRARVEYQALTAAGEKATPVWRQVLGSVFSWQTAMTTGIMLLVMHGKEIGNWIGSLFKGKSAIDDIAEASKRNLEVEKEAIKQSSQYRIEVMQSMSAIKNFTGTKDAEREMIAKLNQKYGESFGVMSTLSGWYDTLRTKAEKYTEVLFLQAKQQTLLKKAVEAEDKINTLKKDKNSQLNWFEQNILYNKTVYTQSGKAQDFADIKSEEKRSQKLKTLYEERDTIMRDMENLATKEQSILDKYKVGKLPVGSIADLNQRIEASKKEMSLLTNANQVAEKQREIKKLENMRDRLEGGKGKPTSVESVSRAEDSLAKARAAAIRKTEQLILEAMEDGYDKERAKAKQEFERSKGEIASIENDLLKRNAELRKKGAKIPLTSDASVRNDASLARVSAAKALDARLATIDKKEAEQNKRALDDLLKPYLSYAEQRAKIEDEYQKKVAEMQAKGVLTPAHETEAKRFKDDALMELDKNIAGREVEFSVLMARIGRMGIKELRSTLAEAESALSLASIAGEGDTDKMAGLRARVAAIQAELKTAEAEKEMDLKSDDKKWQGTRHAILEAKGAIDDMIGSMDFLDESSKEALQAASNIAGGAIAMIDGIKALSAGAAEGISAVEKASLILAIVGTAVKMITSIFSIASKAERKHQEALREVQASRLAFQREMNVLLLQQSLLLKEASSAFGEKKIEKAANAIMVYRNALAQLDAQLKGDKPILSNYERAFHGVGNYLKRLNAYESGMGALYNASIVTGHKKTGFLGWGAGKDTYSRILDIYPELIKTENGVKKLDKELLKTIINTQKMGDETKNYLKHILALTEQSEQAISELEGYLKDTFGHLGADMINAVTTALRDNKSALEVFAGDVGKVFEQLGEQIAYSLFFADQFKALEDSLKGIYGQNKSPDDIARDAAAELDNFYKGIGSQMDEATRFLERWKKEAKEKGYDIWTKKDDIKQSAHAGAFTTITQDQGTKLEGLFTSGQVHWAQIDRAVNDLLQNAMSWGDVWNRIANHTAFIEKIYAELLILKRDGVKTR